MSEDHSPGPSDDEEGDGCCPVQQQTVGEISGRLQKWTNYIHGWQERYVCLREGTLAYYKSQTDTAYGCRGAISIYKATIRPHEFDESRFDVSVNDCVWYLRADNPDERQKWVEALEAFKSDSGYGSENNLRRHGSTVSLTSNTLSGASASSFKKGRGLREKLAEMETFRDILCRQVDTLQSYFEACSESVAALNQSQQSASKNGCDGEEEVEEGEQNHENQPILTDRKHPILKGITKELLVQHGNHAIDFRGEAITFKATTAGILATLSHCLELLNQREESWRKRVEREVEKRKRIEELYKHIAQQAQQRTRLIGLGGPDFEEGPHSVLNEEEFFDAVDAGLDKLENEEDKRGGVPKPEQKDKPPPTITKLTQHPLWEEIDRVTTEQLHYAKLGVGEGGWFIFAEEGEMKMYKREVEEGGMIVDPLKAVHTIKNVTAHEMCHYFFDPSVRMDWEITVETMKVVDTISEDCTIFHQIHKRVWPTTQRDSVFWSHIRRVDEAPTDDSHDVWIVCNNSTDYIDIPLGKCVRVKLTVCLVCQTVVEPHDETKPLSRDDLTCRITYCAVVNPGGWAPTSVLRAVYKREYPRFLKRFTQYVKEQTQNKPIMF